jgi:DNA-directed RNA polymerase subunit RPC12/RpoP
MVEKVIMSQLRFQTSGILLSTTEHPRCPRCQGRMRLSRIDFGPSRDERTYECAKCKHIDKVEILVDRASPLA